MKRGAPASQGKHGNQLVKRKKKTQDYSEANLPRVVPWCNWQEWRSVRACLFSADPQQRSSGVQMVWAWKRRGKVPHSVEATADLVNINSLDTLPPVRAVHELRLMYATAIVRMVNGLVEIEQTGSFAKSVWQLAEKIKLPRNLVDLRHSATHQALPALPTLRNAAFQALCWLETNYWAKQEGLLIETRHSVKNLLHQYKAMAQRSNAQKFETELSECLQSILDSLSANHAREVLLPALLEDGFLVPTQETYSGKKDLNDSFRKLRAVWSRPLKSFIRKWPHFAPCLLVAIFQSVDLDIPKDGPDYKRMQLLVLWAQELLINDSFLRPMRAASVSLPTLHLIHIASQKPHPLMNDLARMMVSRLSPSLLKSKLSFLMRLRNFKPKASETNTRNRHQPIELPDMDLDVFEHFMALLKNQGLRRSTFTQALGMHTDLGSETISETPTMTEEQAASLSSSSLQAANQAGWSKCQSWAPCPLGMLPNNELPDMLLPPQVQLNVLVPAGPLASPPGAPFLFFPLHPPQAAAALSCPEQPIPSALELEEDPDEAHQPPKPQVKVPTTQATQKRSGYQRIGTPVSTKLLFDPNKLVNL